MWFCVLLYFKNVLLLKENIVDNHTRVLRSAQAVSEKMGDSFSKFPSPDPMHINNGICPPGPCSQYNHSFPVPTVSLCESIFLLVVLVRVISDETWPLLEFQLLC